MPLMLCDDRSAMCNNMDADRLCLTKPPEPSNGLEHLFKTIVQTDEASIGAMLEVEAKSGDAALGDENSDFARKKLLDLAFFGVVGIRAAKLNGVRYRFG